MALPIKLQVRSSSLFAKLSLIAACALMPLNGCREQPASSLSSSKTANVEPFNAPANANDSLTPTSNTAVRRRISKNLKLLSEYQLFQGELAQLQPEKGVTEYEINTSLFSDYSAKQRLIRLPKGTSAKYEPVETLGFPVGTVIAKTFYYPTDMTESSKGRYLVETRILLHEESGWVGLPYVWNAQQTDAVLSVAGATVDVEWIHKDGTPRSNSHIVPNFNDCKRCHQNESMEPLGPTARNLNRDKVYEHGIENQLSYWNRTGLLSDAPELSAAPKLAVWDDPHSGTLDARARAWLEVNCAHCHNPKGPARNSGLHLNVDVTDPYQLGVFKTPVAAGKGTGGRLYGIVPGKPDDSILLYRLQTTHSGSMMPEFGRSLVHEESVALIRQWIASMETKL